MIGDFVSALPLSNITMRVKFGIISETVIGTML